MTDHQVLPALRTRTALLVLLILVAAASLWSAGAAGAQDSGSDAERCAFTKPEAIEANGGPLGESIWGRLCQVIDGKATFPEGVDITVSQDGEEVGSATTDEGGVFVVAAPRERHLPGRASTPRPCRRGSRSPTRTGPRSAT